ncbi:hypothetical protein Glove_150g67 [Diversispora epigaea]|uniref:Uncharacterized protein n=1 Tax=Diversispora epigaea TaxID=1348612 RepID=A0A397J2X7_9GLOM|nr:hypothetical protein Glove_150g67 [Diversispora epigaea]
MRDDLQLEKRTCNSMGEAKNPTLPTNLTEWTSDNFLILKETLKKCLSHIRHFSISGDDVIQKILNTTLPTRITSIPSDIITNEHASEISSWIDRKKTPYTENNSYEYKLLVKGSRDDFDIKTIYKICEHSSYFKEEKFSE